MMDLITIEDFSKDVELEEYTSWGEQNSGIKVKFSEGYKRFNHENRKTKNRYFYLRLLFLRRFRCVFNF